MALGLKPLLVGIVSLKFAAVTVGFVGFMVTSPTGEHSRKNYLEHARSVLKKRVESETIDAAARDALESDLATLETNMSSGWRTPHEVATFLHVLRSTMLADARATGTSMRELSENYGKEIWEAAARYFPPQRFESPFFH